MSNGTEIACDRTPARLERRSIARALPVLLAILIGLGVSAATAAAQGPRDLEMKVKAAYLLNFARYISWPNHAFKSPKDPLVIAIVAEDTFGDILERTVDDRMVQGRQIMIVRADDEAGIIRPHILYVAEAKNRVWNALWKRVHGGYSLPVGEHQGFLSEGGVIRFIIKNGSVRFDVSLPALAEASLKADSRMLNAANQIIER